MPQAPEISFAHLAASLLFERMVEISDERTGKLALHSIRKDVITDHLVGNRERVSVSRVRQGLVLYLERPRDAVMRIWNALNGGASDTAA